LSTCFSCGDKSRPLDVSAVPESFTFFDIGANTRLTDSLRSTLESKLGNDSISGRNVLNLEINYSGFLREHFPGLETLNRQLNGSAGIRVEHDTVMLMYRHMQKQNTPFDYVELIFDDDTRKPLVIRIRSGREEADILETLKRRYQEPRTILWAEGGARAYYWEKNGDILILSVTPNPVGRPVFEISMYYVNSIKALVKREMEGRTQERQEEESAVKDAFSQWFLHPPVFRPPHALRHASPRPGDMPRA
jgi:hypothetical protein